ncbi:BRO family protein [Pseudomonas sp.]|uniref:BRO-N domain-containing protein n=1 Tax=Pseudomonas sp. TaxID=306 RepID=UPI0028B0E673|nr:BRO family protein [Pseudomonas sp.]
MPIPIRLLFEGHSIDLQRTDDGQIWFHGREVALLLGYPDEIAAVHRYCRPEGINFGNDETPQSLIDLENVYRLIIDSNEPNAERFADWLRRSLLPQLFGASTLPRRNHLETECGALDVLGWQGEWWLAMHDAVRLFGRFEQHTLLYLDRPGPHAR